MATPKILAIRPDRIGDVVLTTPAFQAIKQQFPESRLTVMVQEHLACLIQGLACVDDVLVYDSRESWSELRKKIQAQRFDVAISFFSDRRIASALFFSKIPVRVGPLSKLHSFLFYNRGRRQHRSQSLKHEAEYNLDLLREIGIASPSPTHTQIAVKESFKMEGKRWLLSHGWDGVRPLVWLHPGMGGSALNWPIESYVQLARELQDREAQLVISAGPFEGHLHTAFRGALRRNVIYYLGARGSDGLQNLCGAMSWADVVVAPSTGPLHLAVALEIPVVSFYPSIRVQSTQRWGPFRPIKPTRVFEAKDDRAMESLSVRDAVQAVEGFVKGKE